MAPGTREALKVGRAGRPDARLTEQQRREPHVRSRTQDDRRYDTETVGLLAVIGILLVAAAGLIVCGAM